MKYSLSKCSETSETSRSLAVHSAISNARYNRTVVSRVFMRSILGRISIERDDAVLWIILSGIRIDTIP